MKTNLFKHFLILLFVYAVSMSAYSQNTNSGISDKLISAPLINFNEPTYDFGTVNQGVALEHIFTFTNSGEGKLTILSVQPSCGCTGATIGDKKEFENGEAGEIKVTFNTQGRTGNIEKTVNVTTNDPANPQLTLRFKCEIKESK